MKWVTEMKSHRQGQVSTETGEENDSYSSQQWGRERRLAAQPVNTIQSLMCTSKEPIWRQLSYSKLQLLWPRKICINNKEHCFFMLHLLVKQYEFSRIRASNIRFLKTQHANIQQWLCLVFSAVFTFRIHRVNLDMCDLYNNAMVWFVHFIIFLKQYCSLFYFLQTNFFLKYTQ